MLNAQPTSIPRFFLLKRPVSIRYFNQVWRSKEQTRRAKNGHCKCAICNNLDDKIKKAQDMSKKLAYREKMKLHRRWAQAEKDSCYARRAEARSKPDDILSLIIDGADQMKFHLPHFSRYDHDSCGMRLPCLLTGCISPAGKSYCYLGLGNLKQGSNLTIEVVFRVLMDTIETKGRLPPICYLTTP